MFVEVTGENWYGGGGVGGGASLSPPILNKVNNMQFKSSTHKKGLTQQIFPV